MITIDWVNTFNVLMSLGVVGLLFAIRDINRSTKVLRESNIQEQARDRELFREMAD
jgi:hypothetical protein